MLYGEDYAKLCEQTGRVVEAKRARKHVEDMRLAVLKHGWDGEWFLRAYDFFSKKIGSKENDEGQLFIESQGFCVMAGIGQKDGKAQKALDSVAQRLDCEYGIVLNNPPFTGYKLNMGEITTYPQGYKENAGIFCHNNPWIMIAETVLGNGDKAWEYFRKICPAYLEEISELHKTEPYVYAQMIAGKDAYKPGEAKNSWLTGTASWNFYTISQYILGIKPGYNGLEISPCIPKSWKKFSVSRKFRGAIYDIIVDNSSGVNNGVKELIVNGEKIYGTTIPVHRSGTINKIVVKLG
ncbi:Cellobiose phosphorylase [subsurface metagenome]